MNHASEEKNISRQTCIDHWNASQISESPSSSTDDKIKGFILQFTYVLLTYKSHLDKEEYAQFIKKYYPNAIVIVAHETSDKECAYDHTHSVINFTKRITVRNNRKFDFNGIHPNIKVLNGLRAYKDGIKYISKQDTTIEVPEEQQPLAELVWQCKNVHEAITKYVKKPSDFSGIRNMYMNRPMTYINDAPTELSPWMQYMDGYIKNTHDNRHIHWIYDPIGKSGKSVFVKHLEKEYQNRCALLTCAPNVREVANILLPLLIEGNTLEYIFIDIPRNYQINSEFYDALEKIKDGRMTSTKFNGGTLRFNNKCLVVFSNTKPRDGCWTYDRLKLIEMERIKTSPPISATKLEKQPIEDVTDIQWIYKEYNQLVDRISGLKAIIDRYEMVTSSEDGYEDNLDYQETLYDRHDNVLTHEPTGEYEDDID